MAGGTRRLAEITPANVSNLRIRWIRQFRSDDIKYESTPLVVGDVIFLTVPPASVVALDAKTGEVDLEIRAKGS